ncbi:MAG: ABC transporter permease [Propionibacteriaceae bacterium]
MNLFSFLADPANWGGIEGILARIGQHLLITAIAVVVAAVISIPLGVLIGHTGRGNIAVIGVSNAARAIPTLGFLVLMVLLLSTGLLPVLIPLTILALPPILTATAAGIGDADANAVHAARALGMTPWQIIAKVEWPLSLALVISGLRSASLQVVATATVAAYVTAGGLGRFVIDGQRKGPGGYPEMFAGAFLVALLAIVLDGILGGAGWLLSRRSRPQPTTADELALAPAA